ncbi:MAG: lipopolysaccharide assembly protein LapA domain-containing protein, partial [Alphaproteobacteria bacterium]
MRIISWIVALLVGVVLVLFAISNRQLVEVGLWPLDATLTVRLFLPVLVFGFVAFLAGGVVAWVSAAPARRLSRQRKRRVAELEQRIAR